MLPSSQGNKRKPYDTTPYHYGLVLSGPAWELPEPACSGIALRGDARGRSPVARQWHMYVAHF